MTGPTAPDTLQRHLDSLIGCLPADWTVETDPTPACLPADRILRLPAWPGADETEQAVAYATVLHEIGHVYDSVVYSDGYRHNPMPAECAAWQWAIDHAIVWTKPMQTWLIKCLCSYVSRCPTESNADRANATIAFGQAKVA